MSKELKNISNTVMDQIHQNRIKMRPKVYFVIGSILTFFGLVFSVVFSVFLVGLIRFAVRSHGSMAQYKLDQMISVFPWWILIFALVGFVFGLWLLKRYDFSYKVDFRFVLIGFFLAIVLGGFVVDAIGLNDILTRRGPMQDVMRKYQGGNGISRVQGSMMR